MSMVFDHYKPQFEPFIQVPFAPIPGVDPVTPPADVFAAERAELRKLIAEFREAVAAARKVDTLTKQPDCEDPEKAKLEERVAALERRLDAIAGAAAP